MTYTVTFPAARHAAVAARKSITRATRNSPAGKSSPGAWGADRKSRSVNRYPPNPQDAHRFLAGAMRGSVRVIAHMTKPLPFTQAGLKRAILAARATGLRVTGIRPDGTLIVDDGPAPPLAFGSVVAHSVGSPEPQDQWGDAEA